MGQINAQARIVPIALSASIGYTEVYSTILCSVIDASGVSRNDDRRPVGYCQV